MKINQQKTKVLRVRKEQKTLNIQISGVKIDQVKQFQYLGITLEDNGRQEDKRKNP